MKLFKWLIGLLLLPACAAVSLTVWALLDRLTGGGLHGLSFSVWGLLIGFGLWLILYFVLPRPMRTYVLAHELTHALWGWVMGARIVGMKVTAAGGHVQLTRSNFLITLAPYFFPLYTMLIIGLHAVLSLFFDLRHYEPVWMGWIGLTWGFHVTFTLSMLRIGQSDIREHGALFSYAVIYLFNILGVAWWIVSITDIAWPDWVLQSRADLTASYATVWHYGHQLYAQASGWW